MSSEKQEGGMMKHLFAVIIIVLCIAVGYILYYLVLGNPSNFKDGNPAKEPLEGSILGLVYKGGILVPWAIAMTLMLLTFSVERMITLMKAAGTGVMDNFVKSIQQNLHSDNVDAAIAECDKQQGAIGNVVRATLLKYKEHSSGFKAAADPKAPQGEVLTKEQRMLGIQKSLEEATALELPMLEKHLTIIATIVSLGTLLGLMGTVLGMIKSFTALGAGGNLDPAALSIGISEALINTFIGITTSAIATIVYNYFTSRIDDMTYRIDEAGFSIVQTFNEKHN